MGLLKDNKVLGIFAEGNRQKVVNLVDSMMVQHQLLLEQVLA